MISSSEHFGELGK